jgi:hypothetical protein
MIEQFAQEAGKIMLNAQLSANQMKMQLQEVPGPNWQEDSPMVEGAQEKVE